MSCTQPKRIVHRGIGTALVAVSWAVFLAGCGEVPVPADPEATAPPPPVPTGPVASGLKIDCQRMTAGRGGPITGQVIKLVGTTNSGKPLDWEGLRGRKVLIVGWRLDCRESVDLVAAVDRAYRSYHGTGLEAVGISADYDPMAVNSFWVREKYEWPTLVDVSGNIATLRALKVGSLPFTILLDGDLKVVATNLGGEKLTEELERLLEVETSSSKTTEAKTGVGKKGQGYGGGIITEPIRQRLRAEQWTVFEVQIPKAMQLFEAQKDRKPKTHDEFMREIIQANQIKLPELPEGESYVYDPKSGKLLVRQPE